MESSLFLVDQVKVASRIMTPVASESTMT